MCMTRTMNASIRRIRGWCGVMRGMSNWYRNKAGRVFANSPWRLVDYWRMTSKPNFDDYKIA